MISIIGIGTGIDTITMKASKRIIKSGVIIGASRIIDMYHSFLGDSKRIIKEHDPKKIKELVESFEGVNISILVSGDTGFYSLADSLCRELGECEILPGISSVNSFFAKLKMPWQDVAFVSMHGRSQNLIDEVRRNQKTFILTGNNIDEIADGLIAAGYEKLTVYVGCNLDYCNELIEKTTVAGLKENQYDKLLVLLIINDEADSSTPFGIDDDEFIRGSVPMTKSEVRACIMSKLKIKPNDVCYDIGAGTGSVTVEMALSSWRGRVIAIEKKEEAIELIKQNVKKFHIGNADILCGEATEILSNSELPKATAAFIGGSDGRLKEIISILLKMNPDIKIVVSAIALETLQNTMDAFKEFDLDEEVVQISVSKNKGVGGLNLMMANNSVYIISTKK